MGRIGLPRCGPLDRLMNAEQDAREQSKGPLRSSQIRNAVEKAFQGYGGNAFLMCDLVALVLQRLGISPGNYYCHRASVEKYLYASNNLANGRVKITGNLVALRQADV